MTLSQFARLLLRVFALLVVLDGAARKWIPVNDTLTYLAKDVLLLAGTGVVLAWQRLRLVGPAWRMPVGMLVIAYAAWCIGQTANPGSPSVLLSLLGLRSHIAYAALVVLIPAAYGSVAEAIHDLRRLLLLSVLVSGIAIVQWVAGDRLGLTGYALGAEAARFGGTSQLRLAATFSYISGFSAFGFFSSVLGLVLLQHGGWRFRGRLWVWVATGLAIATLPMTGSRWPVVALAIAILLLLALSVVRALRRQTLSLRGVGRSALAAATLSTCLVVLGGGPLQALRTRAASTSDASSRIEDRIVRPAELASVAGAFGFGVGTTHQAAARVVEGGVRRDWLPAGWYEAEPMRIMMELGFVGFCIVFALRLCVLLRAISMTMTGERDIQAIGLLVAGITLGSLFEQIVFNAVLGAMFWGGVGLIFLLERQARQPHLSSLERPPLRRIPTGAAYGSRP